MVPGEGTMSNASFVTDHQDRPVWDHVKLIEAGDYGLPEFQRTFVWDDEKVRKLWDSVYRGFPIGQIMLWEPSGDFPMRSLGRWQVDLARPSRCAVIDGQQRLTALWLVLKGDIPLRLDFEKGTFFVSQTPREGSIPLNLLQSLTCAAAEEQEMFFHCATGEQQRKCGAVIRRLNARASNMSKLPSQLIRHAEYVEAVEVFQRLNEQGVRLGESQIRLAVISTKWPGVFRRIYSTLQRLNDEMGFDRLDDPDFLVRAWTAVHTNQHRLKHLAPDLIDSDRSRYAAMASADKYEDSWRRLEQGLKGLTLVMRDKLDLRHFQFVKADFPLIVLVNYFANHDPVSDDEVGALAKWLVMALVTSRYSVRALTKLREDIKATGPGRKVTDLFTHRYEALDPAALPVGAPALREETFRSAYTTLLYILLRRRRAVDWYSRVPIGDPSVGSWHFHHIFPSENFNAERGQLDGRLETAKEEGDEADVKRIDSERESLERAIGNISNLTFLTPSTNESIAARRPSDYLADILEQPGGKDLLGKHLIPIDSKLWLHENFEQFCDERRRLIVDAAQHMLEFGAAATAVSTDRRDQP